MTTPPPEERMSGPVHERCILCVDDDQEFLKSLEFFLPEQINRHRTDELSYRFAFLSNPVEALGGAGRAGRLRRDGRHGDQAISRCRT